MERAALSQEGRSQAVFKWGASDVFSVLMGNPDWTQNNNTCPPLRSRSLLGRNHAPFPSILLHWLVCEDDTGGCICTSLAGKGRCELGLWGESANQLSLQTQVPLGTGKCHSRLEEALLGSRS